VHVHPLATSHGVGSEDAGGVRLLDRRVHLLQRLGELAADVDVGGLGADRVGGDGGALDQRVRRPPHDLAVLERAGLALVRVYAQVVRLAVAGLHE
jgi:hypothetical protein